MRALSSDASSPAAGVCRNARSPPIATTAERARVPIGETSGTAASAAGAARGTATHRARPRLDHDRHFHLVLDRSPRGVRHHVLAVVDQRHRQRVGTVGAANAGLPDDDTLAIEEVRRRGALPSLLVVTENGPV